MLDRPPAAILQPFPFLIRSGWRSEEKLTGFEEFVYITILKGRKPWLSRLFKNILKA
jgi:hypothetical protein